MENTIARSYSPSWVDRLTDWIERLPIPMWAFYGLLYLFAAISLNIASWINGALPWGTPSFAQLYNAIWVVIPLIMIHITDRLAQRALNSFASLVRDRQAELDDIRYRMTTMPARPVFWLWLVVAALLLFSAIQDPSFVIYDHPGGPIHPVTLAINTVFSVLTYSMAPLMIFHAARQLSLVNKAYELVDEVSVFHRQPLYAFSTLTMRTALFLVGMAVISYAAESIVDTSSTEDAITLTLSVIVVPLSLVVVLLPLWGIHQRLQEAKENVLEENSMQTAKLRQQFYSVMDDENYDALPVVESAMESLYKERDQLRGIPTWPWAAGAFRNFLSAVLLPMLLWFLQIVLSRLLS